MGKRGCKPGGATGAITADSRIFRGYSPAEVATLLRQLGALRHYAKLLMESEAGFRRCFEDEVIAMVDAETKLMRMPRAQRSLLLLRYGFGFSAREAAQWISMPERSAAYALVRARRSLLHMPPLFGAAGVARRAMNKRRGKEGMNEGA